MAKTRIDPSLLSKLATRIGKSVKYTREQIRKRASKHQVSSEAYFVFWLGQHSIGAEKYRRSLQSLIQDEIRNLQSNHTGNTTSTLPRSREQRISRAEKRLKIKAFELAEKPPLLTSSTINHAAKNAELYPLMFSLECSVRQLIQVLMEKNYGTNWWSSHVKKEIRDKADKRKRTEQLNPWSGPRGTKDIHYTDFADLANILRAHTSIFDPLFTGMKGGLSFLTRRLDELEGTRNNLSHACPLKDRDRKRIQLYFEEIYDILDTLISRLP
jgi:hypothetical protein